MKKGSDEYFIRIANRLGEAALNKNGDYPAGCVIVKDGKIIARGKNKVKKIKDGTAHAEILALKSAYKKQYPFLKECIVYTNIEPCLMCATAMTYAHIKRVVYGAPHKEYGNLKTFDILNKSGIGKNIEVVEISGHEKDKAADMIGKYVWPVE
jgi:tRNA(adenine34) deaminase